MSGVRTILTKWPMIFSIMIISAMAAFITWNVSIMKRFSFPNSHCYYRFALIEKEMAGHIYLIDIVGDRNGVRCYAKNDALKESYKFMSDSIKKYSRIGDSVYKPAHSKYGWLISSDRVSKRSIDFFNDYPPCDCCTVEEVNSVLQRMPVDFHRD